MIFCTSERVGVEKSSTRLHAMRSHVRFSFFFSQKELYGGAGTGDFCVHFFVSGYILFEHTYSEVGRCAFTP